MLSSSPVAHLYDRLGRTKAEQQCDLAVESESAMVSVKPSCIIHTACTALKGLCENSGFTNLVPKGRLEEDCVAAHFQLSLRSVCHSRIPRQRRVLIEEKMGAAPMALIIMGFKPSPSGLG